MDSTKTFTKIILAAIGIFFLINVITLLTFSVGVLILSFSWQTLLGYLFSFIISLLTIFLLWYFFFHLRDRLAEKLTDNYKSEPEKERIEWFPAALRLGCIFAGLYCLLSAYNRLIIFIVSLLQRSKSGRFYTAGLSASSIISSLVTLAVGMYLVLGAPHFVRWQVKRTQKLYGKQEGDVPVSD